MTSRAGALLGLVMLAVLTSGCSGPPDKSALAAPVDTVVVPVPAARPTPVATTPLAQETAIPAVSPVTVVGESITLSAESQLRQRLPIDSFDAVAGRQFDGDLAALEAIAARDELHPTVVFHGGSNGPIPDGGLERLAWLVGDRDLVVVTVSVPRDWEAAVNTALLDFARRRDNTVVADWKTQTDVDEGLLISDQVHLTPLGRTRYAELVAAAVDRLPARRPGD